MRIIFDLDGTLADDSHRKHYLTQAPKDWDTYFKACYDDTPIWPIVQVAQSFMKERMFTGAREHQVSIWSGRSEETKDGTDIRLLTLKWLRMEAGIDHSILDQVLMRPKGDFRHDEELKREWLLAALDAGQKPDLVFDDRQCIVDMWRRHGIRCCQVAPGDF